jgi:hypothetical protein
MHYCLNSIIRLSFSRTLIEILLVEFNVLCQCFITLSIEKDQILWRMSIDGKFSTHEVYQWLMHRGITDPNADIWWVLSIPLKIKVFI